VIPLRRPQDVVQFTPDAAERIGRAVLSLENQVPAGKPLEFSASAPPQKTIFRMCSFSGAWSKGASKTVTFTAGTSTANTATATNLLGTIYRNVGAAAIARDGTAWYLIAAEC